VARIGKTAVIGNGQALQTVDRFGMEPAGGELHYFANCFVNPRFCLRKLVIEVGATIAAMLFRCGIRPAAVNARLPKPRSAACAVLPFRTIFNFACRAFQRRQRCGEGRRLAGGDLRWTHAVKKHCNANDQNLPDSRKFHAHPSLTQTRMSALTSKCPTSVAS
jgi:hypothetical protein